MSPTLTAEPDVPYMRAVMTPTRDEIRQRINKLTHLPSAARAILIEVCTMVEHGDKGRCYLSNGGLAEKACCCAITVSKHLHTLHQMGLMERVFENADNAKRTLIPSPELAQFYSSDDPESLSTLLRGSMQGAKRGLSRVLRGSKQGANQLYSTKEGTRTEEEESSSIVDVLQKKISIVDVLQKKICALEESLLAANTACSERTAEVLALTERLAKGRELYRADQATIADQRLQLAQMEAKLSAAPKGELGKEKPAPTPKQKREGQQAKAKQGELATARIRFAQEAEALSDEDREEWDRFTAWEEKPENRLTRVYCMAQDPITPRLFCDLARKYGGAAPVAHTMRAMENRASLLRDYVSAYKTLAQWLDRDQKQQAEKERIEEARNRARTSAQYYPSQPRYAN